MTAADVQATFCATLVDEWIGRGVRHAVIAPGSRSTPMALAIAARPEVSVHVVHDERVAAFVALGLGVSADDGSPALLVCTSGTAAANFSPAVVEAGLSDIPLLVLTADRPPELRGVGAAQTIDQDRLYGSAVRWFHDPGVPDANTAGSWRGLAARAWRAASRGPAHLNLPFREPLVGTPGELPPPTGRLRLHGAPRATARALRGRLGAPRGVIVVGGRSGVPAADVAGFAEATGWPVLADPLSGVRSLAGTVTAFDSMLRHRAFADAHAPDLVVRLGRPPASKVLAQWVLACGAPVVQVGGPGVVDPDHNVVEFLSPSEVAELAGSGESAPPGWARSWQLASRAAEAAIEAVLAAQPTLTEPAVARLVAEHRPAGGQVVVASSMPVRDYEWFGGPVAAGYSNRGANGIDGVVSTALGSALAGLPTVALVGDIAFVHDAGALTGLAGRAADLRIVVVDNDGGGIFSFLPQSTQLAADRFEQLFGTPHGTDVVALAAAHHLDAATVTSAAELVARLDQSGPTVTRVPSDRARNAALHASLNAAVASALDDLPGS